MLPTNSDLDRNAADLPSTAAEPVPILFVKQEQLPADYDVEIFALSMAEYLERFYDAAFTYALDCCRLEATDITDSTDSAER